MSLQTESCPLLHPLPLCLPPGFFILSLPHTHQLLCAPLDSSRIRPAARGFPGRFSSLTKKELLRHLDLWSPPSDTWALPLVQTQQLHCSQSCCVPQVFFLAWFTAANLIQIIFALFFPGHCLIISSLFPLGFLCGSHLSVCICRLSFSQVLMSLIGHLVIPCLSILVSLCSCQCIPCLSVSLSEISVQCIQKGLSWRGRQWRCPWKCSQAQGELSLAQLA